MGEGDESIGIARGLGNLAVIALALLVEQGKLWELEESQVLYVGDGLEAAVAGRHEVGRVYQVGLGAQLEQLKAERGLLPAVVGWSPHGHAEKVWRARDGPPVSTHLQYLDEALFTHHVQPRHGPQQAYRVLPYASGPPVMHHASV